MSMQNKLRLSRFVARLYRMAAATLSYRLVAIPFVVSWAVVAITLRPEWKVVFACYGVSFLGLAVLLRWPKFREFLDWDQLLRQKPDLGDVAESG